MHEPAGFDADQNQRRGPRQHGRRADPTGPVAPLSPARTGVRESMGHILCLQDPEIRRRNLITDEELAAVPNGALVVWTSNDPSGPAAAGMDMAEKIRGGRFEHITGAGHWPQWEQRDVFNALALGFLGAEAPRPPRPTTTPPSS